MFELSSYYRRGIKLLFPISISVWSLKIITSTFLKTPLNHPPVLISFSGITLVIFSSPFCRRGRGHSRLCGCDANRSGRSGSRRCRERSWRRQSPAAPCTGGTPWGRPSFQGCGTSYGAVRVSVETGHRAQGYENIYKLSMRSLL